MYYVIKSSAYIQHFVRTNERSRLIRADHSPHDLFFNEQQFVAYETCECCDTQLALFRLSTTENDGGGISEYFVRVDASDVSKYADLHELEAAMRE